MVKRTSPRAVAVPRIRHRRRRAFNGSEGPAHVATNKKTSVEKREPLSLMTQDVPAISHDF
jgi:hypothetical protein